MLAPTIGHYVLARDDGQPLDFIPGQFIQINFDYADGTPARRSYSLSTIHDHALGPGEAVEIAVSHVPGGAATALFEGINPEETIYRSKAVGEPPLMLGISAFLALRDAVAATGDANCIPALQAPATPENVLKAIQAVQK